MLFSVAVLLAGGGAAVRGQSALDGFDPNANGVVRVVVVQPDGKILIGGDFTTLSPNGGAAVTRNRIARLNPDGTLDTAFNPNASNTVSSIAVQADGRILVGGSFTNIGGQTRNRIARLDATTGSADSFNPNASSNVLSIAVQADGRIVVGGSFTNIGGQTRNRIARLDATNGLADSFNPNASSNVLSIAVQMDGKILAGGEFTTIGGQTRNRIARLDASTGLADSFNPNANGGVNSIAVQADGKILAGGVFSGASSMGGQTRNRIARLQTDGRLDRTLNLGVSAVDPDGLYPLTAIAIQSDGKILIGGSFRNVLGVARNRIARLNTDGTLDTSFNPNASGRVYSIAVQADGKVLVGGSFTNIGGQTRTNIARLDATNGLADSFNPNANDIVFSIALQADGNILAGGRFSTLSPNGGAAVMRNRIARLDPAGTLDLAFNPNAAGAFETEVSSIAVLPDTRVLVSGAFSSIGGQPRSHIARLNAATGLADAFNANSNGRIDGLAVQADGKILVGGFFTFIGGQTRNRIARLDATTGFADSFNPNPNDVVYSILVQADGRIVAGGGFTFIGSQGRNRIARFEPDGTLDAAFNPNADSLVTALALQADGKILAGGYFVSISGQTRIFFARLVNDTPALQNLAVTQTGVTWTRDGASPQFVRAVFEQSTDGVNYTPLGNGTPAGSNWTLTGLSLSTGTNLYIRARGYYRSGFQNSSDSITESVRNVVLDPLLRVTAITRSGNDIVITWSVPGYRLEAATALANPSSATVWSNVPGSSPVTLPASGPQRYFRLVCP